jgi:hypothetical protein
LLRAEIDKRSEGHPFKRGIIVSAKTWMDSKWFTEKCPAISIGSENANGVSGEWVETAKQKGIAPFTLASGYGIYMREPRPVLSCGELSPRTPRLQLKDIFLKREV